MPSTQPNIPTALPESGALQGYAASLRRQESQYWYVLAAVCILTTAGLAFAIAPALSDRVTTLWPWANTHIVLVVGLAVSTTLFVAYLTTQKRKIAVMRERMETALNDSARRERQNAARLRALLNVSRMMGSLTSLEGLFDSITKTCVDVFGCQQASLMMINEHTRALETRAATGYAPEHGVKKATLKIGDGIAGWAAKQRTPLILNRDTDPSRYPGLKLKDPSITAAMVVPIVLRDELVGVLNVSNRSPEARYTEEDLQALLVFAENAGTCIRHTEHVEWMRKSIQDHMGRSPKTPTQKSNEALTNS